ncbi:SDR family NAD(P)-dependent oxidoreductase [Rhodococcus sp. 14-2483-1-2]|uniref:SDR family NAD(P)-dependent oxidoreductase n=1 Tax=Rhodococcus sp. 14-2483-1-2 TaxID=2023147 RepID=UPI000B9B42EB|nr:SDR family NAD(P)-dependent oxidoreductase [Rhodococcus sp. 14-2483-1-2]OZF26066.1 oxidoreductase [Rhodococcus sp. 14-2483-1-2]
MKSFTDRVAVVTGGASGIGYALAERFLRAGMKVVIADIEQSAIDSAIAQLDAVGEVLGVRTDVSDLSSVEALAAAAVDKFGGVHLVCNNAGVEGGGWFSDIDPKVWDWVMGVNFAGVLNGCRVFLPLLREQEEGHIVNTASLSAFGTGAPTMTPYCVSKFAVLALSECLEIELRSHSEHIGVSLLVPGPIRTRMAESDRNRPSDVPPSGSLDFRTSLLAGTAQKVNELGLEPSEVAEQVLSAVKDNQFYVLTHPEQALHHLEQRRAWMVENTPPPVRTF